MVSIFWDPLVNLSSQDTKALHCCKTNMGQKGKKKFCYLFSALQKASLWLQVNNFLRPQLPSHNVLVCWWSMNFLADSSTLTTHSQQDVGRGQTDKTDFRAFQIEETGVRWAVCICAAWRVLQIFTISRSRLILLTPETQIRIWLATSNQWWFRQVQLWWELFQRS